MKSVSTFVEKLQAAIQNNKSLLCVGLDVDAQLAPPHLLDLEDWIVEFNRGIVAATSDLVCAYKPNVAFYEAYGAAGMRALKATLKLIPDEIPVIADAKRGDIGNTASAYASAMFDHFGFHALTVNPYLGRDSMEPFLEHEDRGIIVLCKTSNPGSSDFQDVLCQFDERIIPLWEVVAERVVEWNTRGNCGLVVGATYPAILERVRGIAGDMPILVPGIGPQAGDLQGAVGAGAPRADSLVMINAARGVIYASRGQDWKESARQAAQDLRRDINDARPVSVEQR
jgi:orotidine-5'-phosphate decarboxylase